MAQHGAAQREEKQLSALIDTILQHLTSSRNTLTSLLLKIEHEPQSVDWSTVLDNVALVYTQVTNLMRQLQSDKIPAPKYIDFVPFALSVGDPELEKLTEGRLMALDQETIPNYLRTRPERDVEAYLKDGLPKLQTNPENLQRNIAHMNKAIGQISETIAAAKASSKQRESATGDLVVNWSKQQETNLLLAAINGGVGISAASIAAQQQAQQQQQQVPVVPQAQIQQGQGARLNINIR